MNCRHCGGPKPRGQGRKYCSDRCLKLGPATFRTCQDCGEPRLVPDQIRPKARFCAACLKAHARDYAKRHYAEHADEVRARVRAYTEANRERVKQQKAEHYQRNREKIRAKQAEYARAHREENSERSHRWYMANRDLQRQRANAWRIAHLDRRREQVRAWYVKLRNDPVRYSRRLEDERISARLRAERKGRPMKPVPEVVYLKRYGPGWTRHGRVHALPIARMLREVEDLTAFSQGVHGLSDSFISRVAVGRIADLSVRDADILCVALGLTLSLVYPELAQTG